MTLRRHKVKDGDVAIVEEEIKNPWLRIILGTNGWRITIIVLVLSMHPLGRSFLSGFGFDWQDTKKITAAAEEAKGAKSELQVIGESLRDIKGDIAALKANNASLNAKVDVIGEKQTSLEQTFRGFQIDFNKWKPTPPPL